MWSLKAFKGATHVTEPERAAVAHALRVGHGRRVPRAATTTTDLFTYWDYRRGDFHQHRGMRIDLALVTQPLADARSRGRSSTATPARASNRPTTRP